MSIRIFGSLGVGLASKFCSTCGCDCVQACNCVSSPTAIRFWMAAQETDISPDYTCSSCGYLTPFEVTLNAELCSDDLRYNLAAATHWLFRDLEALCDVGTPDEGVAYGECTPISFCANFTPSCNVACFSGSFTTPCYSCTYTGLPEDQGTLPDAVSVVYEYDFRALLGTIGTHEGTPVCKLVCVYFVKMYVIDNGTCTDPILWAILRRGFRVQTSGDCCGTTTDDISDIAPIATSKSCGYTDVDFPYIGNVFGDNPPCFPTPIFVAPPGEGYKRKLVIDC